jgi:hypothetical protein
LAFLQRQLNRQPLLPYCAQASEQEYASHPMLLLPLVRQLLLPLFLAQPVHALRGVLEFQSLLIILSKVARITMDPKFRRLYARARSG